jgi:hypothetical protein
MAGQDWQRLSARVQQRMRELGIADQADLIRATRLSPPTVKGILDGAPRSPTVRPKTYQQLDDGLRWERGSMAAVLAGGEPVVAQSAGGVNQPLDEVEVLRRELIADASRTAAATTIEVAKLNHRYDDLTKEIDRRYVEISARLDRLEGLQQQASSRQP